MRQQRRLAAVSGLDRALRRELAPWKRSRATHDPGKVVLDLAVAVALGGDCLADVAVVRAQPTCSVTSRRLRRDDSGAGTHDFVDHVHGLGLQYSVGAHAGRWPPARARPQRQSRAHITAGVHVIVGCEDAEPAVAQVLSVAADGSIELRVLPGTTAEHVALVQSIG